MHKKLMIVGPTEIEPEILALGAEPQVYMRTPEFSARLAAIHKNLQAVFCTQHPVVFFASSGTGAMDAAVSNFIARGDEAIVINGGGFGQRWVDICRCHGIAVHEIPVKFGKSVKLDDVKSTIARHPRAKALLATYNETSSGALTDVEGIGAIMKEHQDMLFIVDAVSAMLVEPMEPDAWGVDVVLTASQKALAIPPGLSFMAISPAAEARALTVDTHDYYFSATEALRDWRRNQTPFTPAVSLLFQLEKRLEKIVNEGLKNYQARYRALTALVRAGLAELGFPPIAEHPANCVTGVMTGRYDASKIVRIMSERHNVELAPSGGALKEKMFRVGNFGDISEVDIRAMLDALQQTLAELDRNA